MSKKPKLSIIDADGLIFKAGWAHRENLTQAGVFAVQKSVDSIITNLLLTTKADYYVGFFGAEGKKNFRYSVATVKEYKGNRKPKEWVNYFKGRIKKHFVKKWGFYGVGDIEADDCLPILHKITKDDYEVTLIYEDKDLKQIPDHLNYNFGKQTFNRYSRLEGQRLLWAQVLTGDSADHVPGLPGTGPKNADVLSIADLETEEECFEVVKQKYLDYYGTYQLALERMIEQYMLVKMLDYPCFDYPKDVEIRSTESAGVKPKINKIELLNI
jgi:5'-3' exonuclease